MTSKLLNLVQAILLVIWGVCALVLACAGLPVSAYPPAAFVADEDAE